MGFLVSVIRTAFAVDRELESYDTTLRHRGRDGGDPAFYQTLLTRLDQPVGYEVVDQGSTVTVRLPRGTYMLGSVLGTAPDDPDPTQERVFLVQPRLLVDRAQTIDVDARLGRPVTVTVPRPDAEAISAELSAFTITATELGGLTLAGGSFEGLYSGQIGPDVAVPGFRSMVGGTWAKRATDGTFDNSPFLYVPAWFVPGRMVTGFQKRVAERDLATIRAEHAVQVPGGAAEKVSFTVPADAFVGGVGIILPFPLPFTRTEYTNAHAGTRLVQYFSESVPATGDWVGSAASAPTAYQADHSYVERWNRPVFGPALGQPATDFEFVIRLGDEMSVLMPLHGDGAGRYGAAALDSARTVLTRDGVTLADVPYLGGIFPVPPGEAGYRLETRAQRTPIAQLSTQVSAMWTFRSGHVAGGQPVPLPLSSIGFSPTLDERGTAPAGRPYAIPLTVAAQPGSAAGRPVTLTVEVSFDDGGTWSRVPVVRAFGTRLALLVHPAGDGFVSLRAKASDASGNTVEQTIIRAYRIAG